MSAATREEAWLMAGLAIKAPEEQPQMRLAK
jgi:hypothetical protein